VNKLSSKTRIEIFNSADDINPQKKYQRPLKLYNSKWITAIGPLQKSFGVEALAGQW